MSSLQEYFFSIDNKIKGYMLEVASLHDVSVKFNGYYIENNRRTGSGLPSPLYATFNEYREECLYDDVTHIRYFFELTKGNEKHVATVHLGTSDFNEIHFSIEELGGGVKVRNPKETQLSDFSLFMSFVKKKFN